MPISDSVKLKGKVTIHHPGLVNLYGCEVGDGSRIGAFVEIQKGAFIGERCKISSHTFVCEGVTIEDECFHALQIRMARLRQTPTGRSSLPG